MTTFNRLTTHLNINGFASDFLTIFDTWDAGQRLAKIVAKIEERLKNATHGDIERWLSALDSIIELSTKDMPKNPMVQLNQDTVSILGDISPEKVKAIKNELLKLHPWRKGPFNIFGIFIDTEWRSDFKWNRLKKGLCSLEGKRILDVGCGNGYHLWRMYGEGAHFCLGIDPMWLFLCQFMCIKHFIEASVYLLPFTFEEVFEELADFDVVFSMGVLPHRREPLEHIRMLKHCLKSGGKLVLESLVIEETGLLKPEGRYAKMRNVWQIPSVPLMKEWLEQEGFTDFKHIDTSVTTMEEQRQTDWMHFESLKDFLDPTCASKTIEGHPAPMRAVVMASKP